MEFFRPDNLDGMIEKRQDALLRGSRSFLDMALAAEEGVTNTDGVNEELLPNNNLDDPTSSPIEP